MVHFWRFYSMFTRKGIINFEQCTCTEINLLRTLQHALCVRLLCSAILCSSCVACGLHTVQCLLVVVALLCSMNCNLRLGSAV